MLRLQPGLALIGALSFAPASVMTYFVVEFSPLAERLGYTAAPTIVGGLVTLFIARSAAEAKPSNAWLVALAAALLPYVLASVGALFTMAVVGYAKGPPDVCLMFCDPLEVIGLLVIFYAVGLGAIAVYAIVAALITASLTLGARTTADA